MKRMGILPAMLSGLACLGMIVPAFALDLQNGVAAGTLRPTTAGPAAKIDVALDHNDLLLGQVLDVNGEPLRGSPVWLRSSDGKVTKTVTDQSGRFSAGRLGNGTYEIVAGSPQGDYGRGVYRVWRPTSAHPSAQQNATLRIVRGQGGGIGSFLGNPWVIVGIVATAVAIPVVIHNTKDHASP